MLLREFWTNRFWPYCTRNLRESTWVGYESAWRLHVMPVFGGMDMSAISVELVDKWLACFDSAGAARKAWAVLRAILRRAIRWNLLDVDITRRDIQLPAKPHYEPRILTIRQQRTLLRGFYGHLLEAWLICAVSCGRGTEEGYGLEWGDLDLRRGVLHVERGLQWVAGHEAVVPPKTELSRRIASGHWLRRLHCLAVTPRVIARTRRSYRTRSCPACRPDWRRSWFRSRLR